MYFTNKFYRIYALALCKRMAVKDISAPHGLHLMVKNYPYAVNGLKIWSANLHVGGRLLLFLLLV